MSGLSDEEIEKLEALGNDVESHLEAAITDAATNDSLTRKLIESLSFYGKTLSVWEDELAVVVPEDVTHEQLQAIYIQLLKKIQIASHFYTISHTAHAVNQAAVSIRKADIITALVSYYHQQGGKTPPSAIMDKLADGYMRKMGNIESLSKIVKDFWRQKVDVLDKVLKIVSSLAISKVSEMKYLERGE